MGSVLSSIVAAVAIYFAWRGIVQQINIGLYSREEERIESALPELREKVETAGFCNYHVFRCQKALEHAWSDDVDGF